MACYHLWRCCSSQGEADVHLEASEQAKDTRCPIGESLFSFPDARSGQASDMKSDSTCARGAGLVHANRWYFDGQPELKRRDPSSVMSQNP